MSSTEKNKGILDRIGQTWKASFRDIVLIVVSILIAFALDAWWQAGRDRAFVRTQMVGLLDELISTHKELKIFLENLESASMGTKQILERMGPSPEPIQSPELIELFGTSFDVAVYHPAKPTLDSMLASGELSNVDPALLAKLEAWQMNANNIRIDSEHLERNREIDFLPAIKNTGYSFRAIVPPDLIGITPTKFPTNTHALLSSSEVESVLTMRQTRTYFLIRAVEFNINHLDQTIALLKQELGESSN